MRKLLILATTILISSAFGAAEVAADKPSVKSPAYQAALRLRDQKRYIEAIPEFDKLIAKEPKRTELYIDRGLCYSWSAQWDKGVSDFTTALKLDPSCWPARIHRSNSQIPLGRTKEALADAETVIAALPGLWAGYDSKAMALAYARRFAEAKHVVSSTENKIEGAVQKEAIRDTKRKISYEEAKVFIAQKAFSKAVAVLQAVPGWESDRIALEFLCQAGETSSPAAGLKAVEEALKKKPSNDWDLRFCRARFLRLTQDLKGCEKELLAIQSHFKNDPAYWNTTAALYCDKREYEKSKQAATRLIEIDPGNFSIYEHRAMVEMALRERKLAIADLEQSIKLGSQSPNAFKFLKELYVQNKNFNKAEDTLDRAVKLLRSPKDKAAALEARADHNMLQFRFLPAIDDYSAALKLTPGNVALLTKRSKAYGEIGDVLSAKNDAQTAKKLSLRGKS